MTTFRSPILRFLVIATLMGCSNASGGSKTGDQPDRDNDYITDEAEGAPKRDTDNDGLPDFKDPDSDNDGILDLVEAGDLDQQTVPFDSDSDGTPDYLDEDSDDNGFLDRADGVLDFDGDGIADYADLDDDNDLVKDKDELEAGGNPPRDNDMDGNLDYRDPDSDNDFILDGEEFAKDTDNDGKLDWIDTDSDGDGISDADEAGDHDLRTMAADTDSDTVPDFRDADSDGDGISDADELVHGTSRISVDSDGDDVSDLIEIGSGSDPLDRHDSPRTRGDFVFVVPYQAPPDPARDTLDFQTSLRAVDLYFGFDISGSMSEELISMADPTTGVPGIISQLACPETSTPCTVSRDCERGQVCDGRGLCATDPRLGDGCIPDIWTGVGSFDDVDTFSNIVSPQANADVTARSIPDTGWGASEAVVQAPACVADGANCTNTNKNCASTGVGCPGFRPEAVKIYVQITDANNQCSDSWGSTTGRCDLFTTDFTGRALETAGIKFVSLVGTDDTDTTYPGTPESIAREIGVAAGSVDADGNPYVYSAVDSAVVPQTVSAIRALANANNFTVDIVAEDEEGDAGDAIQFIDRLETNTESAMCTRISLTSDQDGDGFSDTFPMLRPGTPVCWDVLAKQNDFVEPAADPLVFKAKLTVRADGATVDTRTIFFLVPPSIPDPGAPD